MSPDAMSMEWEKFRKDELPPNMPPAQLIEHKQTFIAAFQTATELFNLASSRAPSIDQVEIKYSKGHPYVVQKNVPMPEKDPAYPFDEMEIGHSFKLPDVQSSKDDLYKRVSAACHNWNKANQQAGKRLTVRKRNLKGNKFEYRCYMDKPEDEKVAH